MDFTALSPYNLSETNYRKTINIETMNRLVLGY